MATTKTPPAKKTPERRTPPSDHRRGSTSKAPPWPTGPASSPLPVSPEQRRHMIRDAAYFRAERRGFSHGDPVQDWVEAELEVDRLLRNEPGR